jgi:hypothetical protein
MDRDQLGDLPVDVLAELILSLQARVAELEVLSTILISILTTARKQGQGYFAALRRLAGPLRSPRLPAWVAE